LHENLPTIFRITWWMDFNSSQRPQGGKTQNTKQKGTSHHEAENIAMAKNRSAGSRTLRQHGFHGLGRPRYGTLPSA
jgi:hypothetical protein